MESVFNEPLELEFFFANAVRFIPVNLSPADGTIDELDLGKAFRFFQRAVPYFFRRRPISRIARPTAMVRTCWISPRILKAMKTWTDHGGTKNRVKRVKNSRSKVRVKRA